MSGGAIFGTGFGPWDVVSPVGAGGLQILHGTYPFAQAPSAESK